METVIEISSGEDGDLLIIKTKSVKLEKEENVNFTVKTIPGDRHCIVNCVSMFLGKDTSEILSLLRNKFQENIHLYMVFSEYKSTEELLKSLEYIFNKSYNHDTVNLVFEALSKSLPTTTVMSYRRLKDVETTLCVYWVDIQEIILRGNMRSSKCDECGIFLQNLFLFYKNVLSVFTL